LLQQNTLSNTHQEKRDLQAKTKRSKKQKRDVSKGKDVIFFFSVYLRGETGGAERNSHIGKEGRHRRRRRSG
jgi:hypothetical protein